MSTGETLIFIPCYNERGNVEQLGKEILDRGLNADILFMDDHSPDGTGEVLDQMARRHDRIRVIHRPAKMGIGSAHLDGIRWAYDHGYRYLITMDCDLTHSPKDLYLFLDQAEQYDVVVGSRYLVKNSLEGWNPFRKCLTPFGHFMTKHLLQMEYDAMDAFRLYRLDRIPSRIFDLVTSQGYSFFFESLFIIKTNRFRIVEVPVSLPARACGHSKMIFREILHGGLRLIQLYFALTFTKNRYILTSQE